MVTRAPFLTTRFGAYLHREVPAEDTELYDPRDAGRTNPQHLKRPALSRGLLCPASSGCAVTRRTASIFEGNADRIAGEFPGNFVEAAEFRPCHTAPCSS